MSTMMNHKKLQAMAEELAKDIKTPGDLGQLSSFLTKLTVEAALKGEMTPLRLQQKRAYRPSHRQ